ncbi:uncharacterized protein [Misgurnus anguillicaudatus]|uniref:uncharacterized protein n=1 Tax=Misgurnus anguillicaudatus TaxID=75329 RepID=UPI003CCFB581
MPVESCPLCLRLYARLSQHLVVFHQVRNKEERRLLLALESGRINIREGACPVPACRVTTTRLDRHLRTHSELSAAALEDAVRFVKRRKVISLLAELRASDPEVPLVSCLDLEEGERDMGDVDIPSDREEEECNNLRCRKRAKGLKDKIKDLNEQVDTLTESLRELTRRYKLLKRRSSAKGSTHVKQVTRWLLSSLGQEEGGEAHEEAEETAAEAADKPRPSTSGAEGKEMPAAGKAGTPQDKSPPHYPDHVASLNEILEDFRHYQLGPDPSAKLRENISCKVYQIKKFLVVMAEGKANTSNFVFLNKTTRIHKSCVSPMFK